MMEKSKWYQEILRLDPDSRVFFLLAQLYREAGQPEQAINVLRTGLEHVPTYLEARLLLIQILSEEYGNDACFAELSEVTGLLESYPAFWEVWADHASASQNKDLALAVRLMASTMRHPEYSLAQIIESGLALLQDVRNTFSAPPLSSPERECPVNEAPAESVAAASDFARAVPTVTTASVVAPDPLLFFGEDLETEAHAEKVPVVEATAKNFLEEEADDEPFMPSESLDSLAARVQATLALSEEADCDSAPTCAEDLAEDGQDAEDTPVLDLVAPLASAEELHASKQPLAVDKVAPSVPADKDKTSSSRQENPREPVAETPDTVLGGDREAIKTLPFFRGMSLEEDSSETPEDGEEPTLRTRSMADVLAEQGDIAGAIEIYQELEAAAPTPEEAQVLHDCVVALAARVSTSDMDIDLSSFPAEDGDMPLPRHAVPQNRLMSLLESLADRLEARART